MSGEDNEFARRVAAKTALKMRAQRAANRPLWLGLGVSGLIGWSVAVPTFLGAMLGLWWDRHHPGTHSWTLALLVAGLAIGCANAWHWVSRENKDINAESGGDE